MTFKSFLELEKKLGCYLVASFTGENKRVPRKKKKELFKKYPYIRPVYRKDVQVNWKETKRNQDLTGNTAVEVRIR